MPSVAGGPNYTPPAGAGGGGGSALKVDDEGGVLDSAVTEIDFVGAGVTATNVGHKITVTIPNPAASAVSVADTAGNIAATDVEAALAEFLAKPLPGVWLNETDTWTFVSATSFKIIGKDVRSRFPRGTRISYNDGSVDYGVVGRDATLSGSDTLVDLLENLDYSIANATLTAPRFSYDQRPPSFPYFFSYTCLHTGYSADPTMTVYAAFNTRGQLQILSNPSVAGTSSNATHTHSFPKVNGAAVTAAASVQAEGFTLFPSRGIDNGTGQGFAAFVNTGTTAFNTGRITDLANTNTGSSRPGAVIMIFSLA